MSTKKILAVLLALFVLATAVSGCGNSGSSSADSQSGSSATSENSASTEDTASTDGEVPTISLMVVCGTTPPDADAVAEKLSEITREKIGCNVEFITMEIGNVAQQLNLLLSGGDDTLDVFMAGISVPYSTIVNNGQALSLDTLMEPYAEEVKTALGEKVYESGRVNGELYGIGRLLDQASTTCYNLRRDIAEEFGYKNGDKVDLAELTELFGKVREKYPDTPLIGPMNAEEKRIAIVTFSVGNKAYMNDDMGDNYYDFLNQELPEFVEAYFPISDSPKDRYIAGLSMGGYGALLHGIENPDRYSAIGALSPAVFSKKDMESKKTKGPQWVDLYAATEKAVAEGKKLPDLFLSIGDRDFLYKNVQEYHKFVEPIWKSGRLRYDDLPGYEHEFAIWDLEINNFLDWIDRGDVYKKMGANKV